MAVVASLVARRWLAAAYSGEYKQNHNRQTDLIVPRNPVCLHLKQREQESEATGDK